MVEVMLVEMRSRRDRKRFGTLQHGIGLELSRSSSQLVAGTPRNALAGRALEEAILQKTQAWFIVFVAFSLLWLLCLCVFAVVSMCLFITYIIYVFTPDACARTPTPLPSRDPGRHPYYYYYYYYYYQ